MIVGKKAKRDVENLKKESAIIEGETIKIEDELNSWLQNISALKVTLKFKIEELTSLEDSVGPLCFNRTQVTPTKENQQYGGIYSTDHQLIADERLSTTLLEQKIRVSMANIKQTSHNPSNPENENVLSSMNRTLADALINLRLRMENMDKSIDLIQSQLKQTNSDTKKVEEAKLAYSSQDMILIGFIAVLVLVLIL